ncbi:hypothetical protein LCGC14_2766030 [marine sediment metagenome]|uniref:Uncharacterized protein n=1 Tax=marine sediment metagenome TaxID=412755 RepID=A0A0F8ZJD2_9ZZZZ
MRRTPQSSVSRIQPTVALPEVTPGYGYMNPLAGQADLIDSLTRPMHRRSSTMIGHWGVNRPALARAFATFLQTDSGAPLLLVGDQLTGEQEVR